MRGLFILVALLARTQAQKQFERHDNGGYIDGCRDRDLLGDHHHEFWGYSQSAPGGETPKRDYYDNSTFKQLIDHKDPSLGSFDQFYYYDTTHWGGPGSPVVIFTPGEVNASIYYSFLTTNRTTGLLAKQIGAATIVLEHRYWGNSTPFHNLTTANMRYLTFENSIKDMTYFAREVQLPFAIAENASSNAQDVPWINIGGSYGGALAAWTASLDPGTFWAYYASSASVQAVSDNWRFFLIVQEGMAKNCSKDVSLVIDHMDKVLTTGSPDEQHSLKVKFGMQGIAHNDDFMAALENGPGLWLGNQFSYDTGFYTFCDYVENAVNATTNLPSKSGVGLDKALAGYAKWWKEVQLPDYCSKYNYAEFNTTNNTRCFDTYNASSPIFTDTTLGNARNRQWIWITCNEPYGFWKVGAPPGRPSLVSRLLTTEYYIRQCRLYFPPGPSGETYGIAAGRTEEQANAYTGGWNITNTTRLIYVNGEFDPWREVTVSADQRPGGPMRSTQQIPIEIVPGGFHVSDLLAGDGKLNPGLKKVQDRVLKQLADWVEEWPVKKTRLDE